MKDFKLTLSSLGWLVKEITTLLTSNHNKAYRVTIILWRERRSNDQNSLYWKWLGEIANQQKISNDPEIWHEIFKKYYCPAKLIDVPNSKPIEIKSTKKLDTGEMHYYLNRIEQYCIDRGYLLTIPMNCEYLELMERQNQ